MDAYIRTALICVTQGVECAPCMCDWGIEKDSHTEKQCDVLCMSRYSTLSFQHKSRDMTNDNLSRVICFALEIGQYTIINFTKKPRKYRSHHVSTMILSLLIHLIFLFWSSTKDFCGQKVTFLTYTYNSCSINTNNNVLHCVREKKVGF